MNRVFLTVGWLVWLFIALGCGSCCGTGPEYRDFAVPEGKSVIYLYKLPKAWGSAGNINLRANGKLITRLKTGGYYPYVCDPGVVEFSKTEDFGPLIMVPQTTAGKAAFGYQPFYVVAVESNMEYFLKIDYGFMTTKVTEVERAVAKKEMKGLRQFEDLSDQETNELLLLLK